MGMLTEDDIKRIGEEVGRVIEDNVDPRFDAIEGRLDGVEGRLDGVEGRLDKVENRLAGLEGRFDKLDARVVTLTNVLHQKRVIAEDDKALVLS